MRVCAFASIMAAATALATCWGCASIAGGPDGTSILPVKGKVTYKGKPLTDGTITFEPNDFGRPAHGNIQPDGSFVLTTFKEGDGAVRGHHRIAVNGSVKRGQLLPLKLRDPSSSKVEVEVSEGKTEYLVDLN
jgi:hypothetical protein